MRRENIRQEYVQEGLLIHRRNTRWLLRNTISAKVLIIFMILAASSCRCRASCFITGASRGRLSRSTAFPSASNAKVVARFYAGSGKALLPSYARLQPEEEQPDSWQSPRPPRKPPPPKARPMPPTLESYESSNTFYNFEEVGAFDDELGVYDYDPKQWHEDAVSLYNEFGNQGDVQSQSSDWDAPVATTTPAAPQIIYNYEDQADVANPHNYWDEPAHSVEKCETVEEKETPLNPVKGVATTSLSSNVSSEKTLINEVKGIKTTSSPSSNISNEETPVKPPPKSRMPPRASFASQPPPGRDEVYRKASSGDAITSEADMLTKQLKQLEQDIYAQNNNQEFNIKSTRQVSQALFGKPGEPTNKETLEAMGGAGNVMADLILQYRSLHRRLARLEKKEESRSNGTLVKTVSQQTSSSKVSDEEVVDGDPLLLVDASAYIWRAYFSMPPLHRADGMPIGAVLGFCNMLNRLVFSRLLEGECPRLVLVFDAKGKTFRHELYDGYKSHRRECPIDLVPQFDLIREAAKAYGIHQLEAANYEADDVIATLVTMALKEGVNVNILSGDKDLMQLITPEDEVPSIQMVDPITMSRVSHDVVVSKWNVTPDKLGDVLALAGDSADNIPGVPGIGPKIAASLIAEYGSLDELLERVDTVKQKSRREKLKENMDKARLSRRLVSLEREIPLDKMTFPGNLTSAAELHMAPLDGDRLLAFYDSMGFKDLKRRVEARLNRPKASGAAAKRSFSKKPLAVVPTPDDYKDVPF